MGLINESNLTAAGKLFETLVDSAFNERSVSGAAQRISQTFTGQDSTAIEAVLPGAVPAFKRRTDELDYGGVRMYKKTMPLQTQVAAMDLFRTQVDYDRSGAVNMAINRLTTQVEYLVDSLVLDVLDSNVTGMDGVSLVGSTHPHGAAGATWDNSTSNALTFDGFDTGMAFGQNLQDEESEYIGVMYDTLIVPPASRRTALEIAQADARPIAVATDGTINSGGIGATGVTNIYQGSVMVIVSPRLTAGTWYLVDSRLPPVAYCEWMAPRPIVVDQMDSEFRLSKDKYLFAVEADVAAFALMPHGIYGNPA